MDEQLRQAIFLTLATMQSTQPKDFTVVCTELSQRLQQAITAYTHSYVAQQINLLVAANQVGQPARINPIISG
jgi:hypothetical protein